MRMAEISLRSGHPHRRESLCRAPGASFSGDGGANYDAGTLPSHGLCRWRSSGSVSSLRSWSSSWAFQPHCSKGGHHAPRGGRRICGGGGLPAGHAPDEPYGFQARTRRVTAQTVVIGPRAAGIKRISGKNAALNEGPAPSPSGGLPSLAWPLPWRFRQSRPVPGSAHWRQAPDGPFHGRGNAVSP